MKKKEILVIGYFGYLTNQIDGQTIRTRSIHSLLRANYKGNIQLFDTQSFRKSKFKFFELIYLILKADVIFNISAQRNLKYLFPLIFLLSAVARAKLNYVAVGGWLSSFIKNKPIHKLMLSKCSAVYVQTENLCTELRKYRFENIYLLNNFRLVEYPELELENKNNSSIQLVFMARVHPLKGVDLIFEIEKRLEYLGIDNVTIDIYGPIFKEYEEDFFSKVKGGSVNYCGVIEPDDIYHILKKYDLMLFPTKYYTEGFPGSILDAYISAVPVIATNWLNAEEFVEREKTGYLVDFNDDLAFINKTIEIICNPNKLNNLKEHLLIKRNDYSAEAAWRILKDVIYERGSE